MGDNSPAPRRGTRGNPDEQSLSDLTKGITDPRLKKNLESTFTQNFIEKTNSVNSPQRTTSSQSSRPSSSRGEEPPRPKSRSRLSISTPHQEPSPPSKSRPRTPAQSVRSHKKQESEVDVVVQSTRVRQPSTTTPAPTAAGRRKSAGAAVGGTTGATATNKARVKSSVATTAGRADKGFAMPAPSSTKRVKGKRIERQIIIGSEAWKLPEVGHPARPPGVPADHTKGWRVYVRNVKDGPDISTWLLKVQFKIYHTYSNPVRIVESEPFEIQETGWGGFNVDIRLYFQPIAHEKPQYRQHFLQLDPYGNEELQAKQASDNIIRSEICDFIEFNEPTEALFDALTSENQWDYLNQESAKSRVKTPTSGAKKGMGSLGLGRNVDLPDHTTDDKPYSKEMERQQIKIFQDAQSLVDKFMDDEKKKGEEKAQQIAVLKETERALKRRLDEIQAERRARGEEVA